MKVLFAESHNLDRPDPLGSHHYVRLFKMAGHDCLWLGPAVSPFHLLKPDALNRHRFRIWREGGRRVDGIEWLVPLTLLFYYNYPLLRSLFIGRRQYHFCLPPLKKKLRETGFDAVDLLWCAGPVALSLIDLVPHRKSCYRLADRLDKFAMIPSNVGELQKELIRRVDFVLATSQSLLGWVRRFREKGVYYLPNGVSEFFFQPAASVPADFPVSGRPVAVYVGTLDTRFDIETLARAVQRMKYIHFLIIGPVTDDNVKQKMPQLLKEDNFSWLGPKKQAELPAYLQHSDAGIIPFYLSELTEAVNPIKYYEYLASGLPVVAPPLRELAAMSGPLYTYRGQKEFCHTLKKALAGHGEDRSVIVKSAADHTWQKRFEQIMTLLG